MFKFYNSCVSWPQNDVQEKGGLTDLVDKATEVTLETFLKYVERDELAEIEEQLGYCRNAKHGLTMANDWHVTYQKSKHHGECVYFFTHSAIEYVFKKAE